jgi:tRNA A-37 threonylcarbamoyl transferase component Bud32
MAANPQRRIDGKYEILRKIREGGMGAIYKVRHRLLDEVRVIKLMRPQLVDDAEFKARFVREAQTAIKLRHPNIAHLYDFTLGDDDTAFIVMEFIAGKTLEELPKEGGLPPLGLVLEIAQQSLRALAYLHGKGFVHRDISPDNLMLCEDADGNAQIKLIDLGIAKAPEGADSHLTRTGTFLGKLRYAAPEQFGTAGAPAADARGDIYSFGLVLYELLTGVYPISGSDTSSLIAGHLFRPPRPFEETDRAGRVPPALRQVVLRTLAKDPDQRPASARELAQELAAFRLPGDLRPEDWRGLLAQDLDATASLQLAAATSTQDRLDEHFGPTTTPAPALHLEVDRARALAATAVTTVAPAPALTAATPAIPQAQSTQAASSAAAAPPAPGVRPPATMQASPAPADTGAEAIEPLLAGVREMLDGESWREAARLLRRAELFAPAHPEVLRLRAAAAAASHRRVEERRRRGRVERLAAEVTKALDRGDVETGAAILAAALAEMGESEAWQAPRERLAQMQDEVRLAQLGALLMRARQLAAKGDLQQALERLEEVRRTAPDHPGVQSLADELTAEAARLDKERRRGEKQAQAVAAVQACLARQDLAEASRLLDLAVVRFGASPALREQWEKLEKQRREGQQRQVDGLLERARVQAAAGNRDGASVALAEARQLAGRSSELLALVARAESEMP